MVVLATLLIAGVVIIYSCKSQKVPSFQSTRQERMVSLKAKAPKKPLPKKDITTNKPSSITPKSAVERIFGPSARVDLCYTYGDPGPRMVETIPQDFLYAGRGFAFQIEINHINPSSSHKMIPRCYWENYKDQWHRWVDMEDVPITIPAGQKTYHLAFAPNVLGIPGFSRGRNKIEIWLDGELLTTRYYETKLNPNRERSIDWYPLRPIKGW